MQDPSKVIFSFAKYELSNYEKRHLVKGLNLSLPHKYFNYTDSVLNFELFYRNICNLGILSNEGLDFVKAKTETTLFSYQNYYNNVPQHLSKEEFLALKST